jgi:hypothetical protein
MIKDGERAEPQRAAGCRAALGIVGGKLSLRPGFQPADGGDQQFQASALGAATFSALWAAAPPGAQIFSIW